MSTTQLSNAVIPEVYLSYTAVNNPETTAFFQSGIIASSDQLTALAAGPSRTAEMPFWKDLDPTIEPNYGNDDPTDKSVPNNVSAAYMVARKAFINQSYSTMDLVQELAGSSPMQQIRNRFGVYWQRQFQRRLIAAALGVQAANVAQNAGDMTLDVSIADGNAATAANLFSRSNFVHAAFTMGDRVDGIMAIAVHSVVYKRMTDNDDIAFITDSQGQLTIPTYMGRRVVVDDSMPVVAGGTSGFKYTSILFGQSTFAYGQALPAVPVAVFRDESSGAGAGQETIWERYTWLIHPFGHKWTETTVSQESPTNADLKLAVNWNRVIDRKLVPMAFLITNG